MSKIIFLFFLIIHICASATIDSNQGKNNQPSQIINDIENISKNYFRTVQNRQDKLFEFQHGYHEPSSFLSRPVIAPHNIFNGQQTAYNIIPLSENIRNEGIFRFPTIEPSSQNIPITSPIHYIRLSPSAVPYVLFPNLPNLAHLSYPTASSNDISLSSSSQILSSLNHPLNFIPNEKPQTTFQYGNPFNPVYLQNFQNFHSQSFPIQPLSLRPIITTSDSKIFNLKNTFPLNGKPEDVYIIPNNNNNFNHNLIPNPMYLKQS